MSPEDQVSTVFLLLKQHLKVQKLSYFALAKKLNMSESNLKRIFSTQSCGFEQIAKICAAAEVSFFDIVGAAAKAEILSYSLSSEAEEFFLKNFDCFIFYRRLSVTKDPSETLRGSKLPKAKVDSYLAALEKYKLLRRTRESVEFLNSGYLDISKSPELAKKIREKWVPWFFERTLRNNGSPNYFLAVGSTGLSKTHRLQLNNEIEQLIGRYKELGHRDQSPGSSEEFEPVGICVGVGPHRIGLFEDYQF